MEVFNMQVYTNKTYGIHLLWLVQATKILHNEYSTIWKNKPLVQHKLQLLTLFVFLTHTTSPVCNPSFWRVFKCTYPLTPATQSAGVKLELWSSECIFLHFILSLWMCTYVTFFPFTDSWRRRRIWDHNKLHYAFTVSTGNRFVATQVHLIG